MKRLLFSFLFVLTAIAGWAQEPTTFTVGNFNYVETDAENHYVSVAQNGENKPSGAVVIPSSVTYNEVTYTVTSIADNGFYVNEDITEVTIPNTVTSIGENAFVSCSKLTTITLPSTLTKIGNYAFYGCSSLASFSVPGSVTTIGSMVFDLCSIPTFTFEASNTAITCNSGIPCTNHLYLYRDITPGFEGSLTNSIKALTIGAHVTTIYNNMFNGSQYLNSIDFSEATGLTSIGDNAFYGCGNYVPTDPEEDPVPNLTTIDLSNTKVTSIGQYAFQDCNKLTGISLPNTLQTINDGAFHVCSSLASFSVPGSVTTIGSMVFDYCSIPTFTFEASNTAITCSAGIPCTNLYLGRDITFTESGFLGVSALTIGTNVTSIGSLFFYNDITSVTVPWDSPITIDDYAFSDETFTKATLWIPGGTKAAYEAADGWKKFTNMDFSSFVVSITGSAHGTLAVGEISSTNNETATTLIDRGEDAVFTVTPATGYEASTFTVNGEAAALTDNSYTVENLSADQTVVAGFTAINYTLTYTLNGGTATNPATYTIETETFTLNNPTKAGYDFAGWKLNGEGEAMMTVTITQGCTGHLAYTATWTPTVYNIVYTMDGGTATPANPTTYTIETETFTLNNPTKTGYDFAGWKLNGEGDAMMTVTITQGSTGNLAYTATWTPTVYNIVYTMDGGTATPANPTTYTIETETFTLNNPTKTGYDFAGWKLNGEGDAMMEVTIAQGSTGHLAYTATWTPITYNIVYTMDGGTATPANPTTYTIETPTFTLNNPTKTGYTFKGWKLNGEDDAMMTVTITQGSTGDKGYTATWQVNQYTITFNSNGGSAIDPITQDYGTTVTVPDEPTKSGYNFGGWTPALPETMPAENITVTAIWTINTYTVSITGAGVTADKMNPEYGDDVVITIAADEDRTLNTLTVNGVDVTASVVDGQYTIENVTGNVTVVATFNSTKEFITLAQGVGTFSCSQDLNFTGSELKAYIAAGYNKSTNVTLLVRVYDVPAGTGLYLKGGAGVTYKIPYSTSQAYYVNMLKANLTAGSIDKTDGDMSNFLLSNVDGVYMFRAPSDKATLGAQKAYLQLPTSFVPASARAISLAFEDDETTNINDFEMFTNSNDRLYNLKGQRIEKAGRGIYIKNGKKVVIK